MFELKEVDVSAREKISTDIAESGKYAGDLILMEREKTFPGTWALDFGTSCYLMRVPQFMREESGERRYYFYFENVLYKLSVAGHFGSLVESCDNDQLPVYFSKSFKAALTEAFLVYGRIGKGQLNEFGLPEYAITPIFKEVE